MRTKRDKVEREYLFELLQWYEERFNGYDLEVQALKNTIEYLKGAKGNMREDSITTLVSSISQMVNATATIIGESRVGYSDKPMDTYGSGNSAKEARAVTPSSGQIDLRERIKRVVNHRMSGKKSRPRAS